MTTSDSRLVARTALAAFTVAARGDPTDFIKHVTVEQREEDRGAFVLALCSYSVGFAAAAMAQLAEATGTNISVILQRIALMQEQAFRGDM